LKVLVSASTSRLDPVSGSCVVTSWDAVICASDVDRRSIGSVSSRASQKLPTSASPIAPTAMSAIARVASRCAGRDDSSIDPSVCAVSPIATRRRRRAIRRRRDRAVSGLAGARRLELRTARRQRAGDGATSLTMTMRAGKLRECLGIGVIEARRDVERADRRAVVEPQRHGDDAEGRAAGARDPVVDVAAGAGAEDGRPAARPAIGEASRRRDRVLPRIDEDERVRLGDGGDFPSSLSIVVSR
jgi:hypothetical protein